MNAWIAKVLGWAILISSYAGYCFAQTDRLFPVSLEAEVQSLSRDQLRYEPDIKGIDFRSKNFPDLTLAWLYLSAVKEQYEVTQLQVLGTVQINRDIIPLHDAHHLFDERMESAYGFTQWYSTILRMIPDLEHEVKMEIRKAQTFTQLQNLRVQIMKAMIAKNGSQDAVSELSKQVSDVIATFPGNSQKQRKAYLDALATSGQFDENIKNLLSEIRFQTRLAQATQTVRSSPERSLFFFSMLNTYFQDLEGYPYLLWPKMIPVRDRENPAVTQLKIRFFISERTAFLAAVFNQELPVELVTSWYGLRNAGASASMLGQALNAANQFVGRYQHLMSETTRKRMGQALELMQIGLGSGTLSRSFTSMKAFFHPNSFSYETDQGHRINPDNFFRIYGLRGRTPLAGERGQLVPLGLQRIVINDRSWNGERVHTEFRKEQFQVQADGALGFKEEGQLPGGARFSQTRVFVNERNPYARCQRPSPASDLVARANENGKRAVELMGQGKTAEALSLLFNSKHLQDGPPKIDEDCHAQVDAIWNNYRETHHNLNGRILMDVKGGIPTINGIVLSLTDEGQRFVSSLMTDWKTMRQETFNGGVLVDNRDLK